MPLPSCLLPLCQNESSCENIHMRELYYKHPCSFSCIPREVISHVWNQRHRITRKLLIHMIHSYYDTFSVSYANHWGRMQTVTSAKITLKRTIHYSSSTEHLKLRPYMQHVTTCYKMFLAQCIVNRGEWLWSPANIKGAKEDTKI